MSCIALSYIVVYCLVVSCIALYCLVLSCLVFFLSCLVLSCHVSSCLVLSCFFLLCHIVSCLAMSWLVFNFSYGSNICLLVGTHSNTIVCYLLSSPHSHLLDSWSSSFSFLLLLVPILNFRNTLFPPTFTPFPPLLLIPLLSSPLLSFHLSVFPLTHPLPLSHFPSHPLPSHPLPLHHSFPLVLFISPLPSTLRDYTQVVMNYLEGRKAGEDKDLKWADYFDVVIVGGNKPAFLEDDRCIA